MQYVKKYTDLFEQYIRCLSFKKRYKHLENGASYIVVPDGNKLYIYFQWSKGAKDWVNNFRFLARPVRPYKDLRDGMWFCHGGFLEVWKSIEPLVADEIRNIKYDYIEVGGYSHGAAIAQLCYEYIKYHRQDVVVKGVGFGCPRVVWGILPSAVKTRFEGFKVVRNCKDIVTHVPPVIFGFRHVGEIIKIGSFSEGMFDDHRPELYIESLESELVARKLNYIQFEYCCDCEGPVGDSWHIREGKCLCGKCTDKYDDRVKEMYF